ncbi:aminotransferase class I/II-fold pyridoxal phosphate-dependent enzyme, partial [Flavobacteriales bacterium]|nr:aminotransferase class I/II-fold pyridoxal phosphate-dependent enzyme [Flavobacteriales bacterium]
MNYKRLNDLTGWAVWLIASVVYLLTIEPTASFWDCGEFIASAYKLEVGHPPGAPMFMLLARLFSMFFPAELAANAVNVMSAMASSFTILFLFWSVTHMARKLALSRLAEGVTELSDGQRIAVLASGAVGALAYTFSDSFWFSAVEGEVYALSSLFTALVFWAILKWEARSEEPGNLRWIVLIAYLMGLSIGVHLLNLLAIPAIVAVYYFKRNTFKWPTFIGAMALSLALLLFVQYGLIQGFVKFAARFELAFVNSMGLPFNTGVAVYIALVIALIVAALWWSRKKGWWQLNVAALSVAMILVGYSTFALIVVRSAANPPMDENNPENLFALLAYLNREQYGDRPLGTGQYWNSPNDMEDPYSDGSPSYFPSYSVYKSRGAVDSRVATFKDRFAADKYMGENEGDFEVKQEYVDSGEKRNGVPRYDDRFTMLFPRMYSSQANHINEYKRWSNYKGWNEDAGFVSPIDQKERDAAAFEQHIASRILGSNMEKSELSRTLNNLYRSFGQRFGAKFEVRKGLRAWICNRYAQRNGAAYDVGTECTIGAGASSLIFAAIQALVHTGQEVVVQTPAYDLYAPAIQLAGGILKEVPLLNDDGQWNLPALRDACGPHTRMVILNTPHNPTGTTCPPGFLDGLQAQLSDTDTLVLSDEVYGPIVHDGRPETSLAAHPLLKERSLVFGSFGKLLQVTGWKIGWAVGPAALMAELRKVHQYDVFSTGAPLQAALERFLPSAEAEAHLNGLAGLYGRKRDRLLQGIRDTAWRFTPAEGGFFQVLNASRLIDNNDGQWARTWTRT